MEKYLYHYTIFGQTSDPNAYGGSTYNSAEYGDKTLTGTEEPTGTDTTTNTGGELANTGLDFALPLALGATMIVGSVIALIKMHKDKKTS